MLRDRIRLAVDEPSRAGVTIATLHRIRSDRTDADGFAEAVFARLPGGRPRG